MATTAKGALFPFRRYGRWGYLNRRGEVAIDPQFRRAGSFHDGLAWVHGERGWQAIDEDGGVGPRLDAPDLFDIGPFHEGLAVVRRGVEHRWRERPGEEYREFRGTYNFVDRSGCLMRPPAEEFDVAEPFFAGYARVHERDGAERWIRASGAAANSGEALDALAAADRPRAEYRQEEGWVYVDGRRRVVCRPPVEATGAEPFREGLAAFRVPGAMGFIDLQGNVVAGGGGGTPSCSPRASRRCWRTGVGRISTGWGGRSGPDHWDEAGPFLNGLAWVRRGRSTIYLDMEGRAVWTGEGEPDQAGWPRG
jgi:hypothetical protein